MPTYQYACTSCGEQLEVVQSFSDASLTTHEPGCGGPLRKVFGSVGVVFKGSGFYRTDSRAGGTVGAEPSKSDSSKSESGKSESSPAAKSESKSSESKPAASSSSSSGSGSSSSGSGSSSSGSSTAAA